VNITVEGNKTLIVDGPASVMVVSGKVEVFGLVINRTGKVVVRDGKRMPFKVLETTTFDISLGENACVEEVQGSTIPPSWEKAHETLSSLRSRPAIAMVLGAIDSGKTSFCTYLVNKLLASNYKVAIIDGDLGQADVGPPCTVAYAITSKPITDLFNLTLENAFFVGVTSPSKAIEKTIQGLTMLKDEVLKKNPDFIVVNTDGWVDGEDAVKYKVQLVEKINPDIIFLMHQDSRLTPLLSELGNYRTLPIESPTTIKQRSKEKRRSLRELGYFKYLRNAKVQSIPIGWVKIENGEHLFINRNPADMKLEETLQGLIGVMPLHVAELKDKLYLVFSRGRQLKSEEIMKLEKSLGKKVVATYSGDEEGLLVALYNGENKFLGIGILREIDYRRRTMKVCTPVSSGFSKIVIGKVRLDKSFKEVSTLEEKPDPAFPCP